MRNFLTGEKRATLAAQEAEELLEGPLKRRNWSAETRDAVAAYLIRISDDEKLEQRAKKRQQRMRKRTD